MRKCEVCGEKSEYLNEVTPEHWFYNTGVCDECVEQYAEEGDGLVWTGYEWVDPPALWVGWGGAQAPPRPNICSAPRAEASLYLL